MRSIVLTTGAACLAPTEPSPASPLRRAAVNETLERALSDRYTIERELGRGGMATVYLATDARHHRRVAVKVLHPELSAVLRSQRFPQKDQGPGALSQTPLPAPRC